MPRLENTIQWLMEFIILSIDMFPNVCQFLSTSLFLLVSQPSIAFHLRMAKLSAFCLFADEQTLSRALPGKMDRIHRLQITTLNQDSVPNERNIGNLFQTSSFLLLLTKRMVLLNDLCGIVFQ